MAKEITEKYCLCKWRAVLVKPSLFKILVILVISLSGYGQVPESEPGASPPTEPSDPVDSCAPGQANFKKIRACSNNAKYLCEVRSDSNEECLIPNSRKNLSYCKNEGGLGFGLPQHCLMFPQEICSWDNVAYDEPCIPIYGKGHIPYCIEPVANETSLTTCSVSNPFQCQTTEFECIQKTAGNNLPFCIAKKGNGVGNPFPCNHGKSLLCALSSADTTNDSWCVIQNQ